MKKDNTINASSVRIILIITLVTLTMFALGYMLGEGLFYLFN